MANTSLTIRATSGRTGIRHTADVLGWQFDHFWQNCAKLQKPRGKPASQSMSPRWDKTGAHGAACGCDATAAFHYLHFSMKLLLSPINAL
jgi:hypothetical protein